jgi:trehalose 6-phosphate synthase
MQMRDALIVNPFSQEDVADAIKRALNMELPERRRRWRKLLEGVEKEDVAAWRDAFVRSLERARIEATAGPTPPTPRPKRSNGNGAPAPR